MPALHVNGRPFLDVRACRVSSKDVTHQKLTHYAQTLCQKYCNHFRFTYCTMDAEIKSVCANKFLLRHRPIFVTIQLVKTVLHLLYCYRRIVPLHVGA